MNYIWLININEWQFCFVCVCGKDDSRGRCILFLCCCCFSSFILIFSEQAQVFSSLLSKCNVHVCLCIRSGFFVFFTRSHIRWILASAGQCNIFWITPLHWMFFLVCPCVHPRLLVARHLKKNEWLQVHSDY